MSILAGTLFGILIPIYETSTHTLISTGRFVSTLCFISAFVQIKAQSCLVHPFLLSFFQGSDFSLRLPGSSDLSLRLLDKFVDLSKS